MLDRFHLTVDYPHDRVLFAPPVDTAAPFAVNRAGLALQPMQAGAKVLSVASDSLAVSGPAGEALEVRLGDQRILHLTLGDYI